MGNGNVYKWSLTERIGLAVINFGGNIVLTRMLDASDFGLLAMVAIFTSIAFNLSSCGLSDGLIHKQAPTEKDYSTVFVFNSVIGLIIGGLAIALAGVVADFFGHQELRWIMRMFGICFFFQTMSFVQETRMRKRLEMRKICIARLGATITSLAVGVALAWLGCGYWALVSTQIFLSFFTFVFFVALARWFPRVEFSVKSFKEFFGYGVHLMISYIGSMVSQNVNTFVLGRAYPSPDLSGLYYQGAKLAGVPFAVSEASINMPFFVVASNEPDPAERRRKILDMFWVIMLVNSSIALLLLLLARPAIVFLYGAKWAAAAPVLSVMAVFGMLMCLKYYCTTIFKVYGRTRFIRNLTFVEIAVQLGMLALFYRCGLTVVALTQLSGCAVAVVVFLIVAGRMLPMSLSDVWRKIFVPVFYPAAAFVFVAGAKAALHALTEPAAFVECVFVGVLYAAALLAVMEVVKPAQYMVLRRKVIK